MGANSSVQLSDCSQCVCPPPSEVTTPPTLPKKDTETKNEEGLKETLIEVQGEMSQDKKLERERKTLKEKKGGNPLAFTLSSIHSGLHITGEGVADKLAQLSLGGVDEDENRVQVDENDRKEGQGLPKKVLYYGWFFNAKDSLLIKDVADAYLNECLKVPQFRKFLICASSSYGVAVKDIDKLYEHPNLRKSNSPSKDLKYHITAKFLGREENVEYATLAQKFLGKGFKIHLVGLYFTSKSWGVRIELTQAQSLLFDNREGQTIPQIRSPYPYALRPRPTPKASKNSLGFDDRILANFTSTELLELELQSYDKQDIDKDKKTKDPKCESIIHSQFYAEDSNTSSVSLVPCDPDNFRPTLTRAHITIGTAPRVPAIQTGIDLLDIIDYERRAMQIGRSGMFTEDYPIDGGTLRQFGKDFNAFAIYPCHKLVVEGVFNYFQ